MATRALDWNGLLTLVNDNRSFQATLAGVPVRVKRHRGTDIGFYVYNAADADGEDPIERRWSLRAGQEVVLLRALVEAGQLTIDDPDAPAQCGFAGCADTRIDGRGPVRTVAGEAFDACTEHWEAAHIVIGRQDRDEFAYLDDHLEQVVNFDGRVMRESCTVCGGGRGAHRVGAHNDYEQQQREMEARRG